MTCKSNISVTVKNTEAYEPKLQCCELVNVYGVQQSIKCIIIKFLEVRPLTNASLYFEKKRRRKKEG